jgi:hypothetical protein
MTVLSSSSLDTIAKTVPVPTYDRDTVRLEDGLVSGAVPATAPVRR